MSFFIFNDKVYKEGQNSVSADNRGLRYGDGLFETMKVSNGVIQLKEFHFDRLFAGMNVLQFEIPKHFSSSFLENKILELCKKNEHSSVARVRLMLFRSDGGLYDAEDHFPNYVIQSCEMENNEELNSNGLIIDIYPDAKKSCDTLANIKSNNFLPYAMSALHAKKSKVNDCILLNNYDRICDSTIANIFIIKDEIIYTPALSEGCIAGVMRRFIIEKLKTSFKIIEKEISINELENADEVFLTNSIKGIRWVKQFRSKEYGKSIIRKIFAEVQQQLV
jgi:branched-chain amino acid aminotransferase